MEAYVQYLDQVLGLRSLVWPEAKASEIPLPQAKESLLVLFVFPSAVGSKAQELFEKMREAMKIPSAQTRLVFADQMQPKDLQLLALTFRHAVCFSREIWQQLQVGEDSKTCTHHPDELLQKPELKKEAWEDLKKVLKVVQK
jgi:hypothetical protein